MGKKVLMVTVALLAFSIMIAQGAATQSWTTGGDGASVSAGRQLSSIVSTIWLRWNLDISNLVVLDVRDPDSYSAGHIPGAINVPEGNWYINPPFGDDLPWMEIPPEEDLIGLIGNAGITPNSWVVVVGFTSGLLLPEAPLALYNTAGITRVAMALLYAGVANVAILDGGYDKWVVEGKPVSTDPVTPIPVTYEGTVDETMLVSAEYVESKIGESILVDARDWVIYCGIEGLVEPWALDPGHIPTARNLPAPTLWNVKEDGEGNALYITYKDVWSLWRIVYSVVPWSPGGEIIVYCGVGGYASTVYFMLSEVFRGFRNVRVFDGSAQEWYMLGNEFVPC